MLLRGYALEIPSPGTPGEGRVRALLEHHIARLPEGPHPDPLPEYRERGKEMRASHRLDRLLDRDDHRIGAGERFDPRVAETGVAHPLLAVGAGVVEAAGRFDQHVQAHQ